MDIAGPRVGPPLHSLGGRVSGVSALNEASRRPKHIRPPLLHVVLVQAPNTQVFHYGRCLQLSLVARGIDVYLQDRLEESGAHAHIHLKDINNIVSASRADKVIVLDEHSVASRSCKIQLDGRLIPIPVEDCVDSVLKQWAADVSAVLAQRPQAAEGFAKNPNLVTKEHLAFFLQKYIDLAPIHSLFYSLDLFAENSRRWLRSSDPVTSNIRREGLSGKVEVPSGRLQETDTKPSAKDMASIDVGERDMGKSVARKRTPDASEQEKANPDAIARKTLECLKKSVEELRTRKDWGQQDEKLREWPSGNWLRSTRHFSSRILAAQILARRIHENLTKAFMIIATLPGPASRPRTPNIWSDDHLPTESHRQRLLCELNDMLPRVEALGAKLTRKPRKRARRALTSFRSPWTDYVERTKGCFEFQGVAGLSGCSDSMLKEGGWKCSSCQSANVRGHVRCSACKSALPIHNFCLADILNSPGNSLDQKIRNEIHVASAKRMGKGTSFRPAEERMSRSNIVADLVSAFNGVTLHSNYIDREARISASLPLFPSSFGSHELDVLQQSSVDRAGYMGMYDDPGARSSSAGSSDRLRAPVGLGLNSTWSSAGEGADRAQGYSPFGTSHLRHNSSAVGNAARGMTEMGHLRRNSTGAANLSDRNSSGQRPMSIPAPVDRYSQLYDEDVDGFTSLQALAAASDAANGGSGSATSQSIANISALFSGVSKKTAGYKMF